MHDEMHLIVPLSLSEVALVRQALHKQVERLEGLMIMVGDSMFSERDAETLENLKAEARRYRALLERFVNA